MKKLLSFLILVPALMFAAAGDIKIDTKNSSDTAWITTIFAKANGGILGTSSTGVPRLVDITWSTASSNTTISSKTGNGLILSSLDAGNVQLLPYDPAAQGAVTSQAVPASATIVGTGGFQVVKQAVSGSIFPSLELVGYQNGQTAQMFIVIGKAGGTQASPTTATANATIGGYRFYARANAAWKSVANISVGTSTTFGDSDFSTVMHIGPSTSVGTYNAIDIAGGNGGTGLESGIAFGGQAVTTTATKTLFAFDNNGNYSRSASWGTSGAFVNFTGKTVTDTVSSGTVAVATYISAQQPTFASSSATTFTDAFNGYWAGPVVNGSGVTITRSHTFGIIDSTSSTTPITGGFIVATTVGTSATSVGIGGGNINAGGSVTLGGRLVTTPSALTYASPTSVDVTLASCYTVTTVNATGSVTFNATAGGTAGQDMTILITNDATSAKTITFGTNFLTTGTLTASAVSRHTSITFKSDGTSWYETGRAVLTN